MDAVGIYVDTVRALRDRLALADIASRGFLAFREYLAEYLASSPYTALVAETAQVKEDLAQVTYCLRIQGSRITVSILAFPVAQHPRHGQRRGDVTKCLAAASHGGEGQLQAEQLGADTQRPEPVGGSPLRRRLHCPGYFRRIPTIFSSVISWTAYFGPSFPNPLSLQPAVEHQVGVPLRAPVDVDVDGRWPEDARMAAAAARSRGLPVVFDLDMASADRWDLRGSRRSRRFRAAGRPGSRRRGSSGTCSACSACATASRDCPTDPRAGVRARPAPAAPPGRRWPVRWRR